MNRKNSKRRGRRTTKGGVWWTVDDNGLYVENSWVELKESQDSLGGPDALGGRKSIGANIPTRWIPLPPTPEDEEWEKAMTLPSAEIADEDEFDHGIGITFFYDPDSMDIPDSARPAENATVNLNLEAVQAESGLFLETVFRFSPYSHIKVHGGACYPKTPTVGPLYPYVFFNPRDAVAALRDMTSGRGSHVLEKRTLSALDEMINQVANEGRGDVFLKEGHCYNTLFKSQSGDPLGMALSNSVMSMRFAEFFLVKCGLFLDKYNFALEIFDPTVQIHYPIAISNDKAFKALIKMDYRKSKIRGVIWKGDVVLAIRGDSIGEFVTDIGNKWITRFPAKYLSVILEEMEQFRT